MAHVSFILASASPRRLKLLQQIGLTPAEIIPADIDESPRKDESPRLYAKRIAQAKAHIVAEKFPESIILAADTVVACGSRILPKADDEKSARLCLKLLGGRRHRVYTAVCVQRGEKKSQALVMTQVAFRRLSKHEIDAYIASNEWQGKAGGYAIQGLAEAFIPRINGSYSNVVGLPLAETKLLLQAFGV